MGQFTVEVKINNTLILSRSATRISGILGEPCLYIADDGRAIEHHYNNGAAVLAIKLLAGVHNIMPKSKENLERASKWERLQQRLQMKQRNTSSAVRPSKKK